MKMWSRFTYRAKIITITVSMVFISLILVGAFFSYNMYRILEERAFDSVESYALQAENSMSRNFEFLDNMFYTIIFSEPVKKWLNREVHFSSDDPEVNILVTEFIEDLSIRLMFDTSWTNESVQSVYILADDQVINVLKKVKSSDEELLLNRVEKSLLENSDSLIFLQPTDKLRNIVAVQSVMNYYDESRMYIVAEMDQENFFSDLSNIQEDFIAQVVGDSGEIYHRFPDYKDVSNESGMETGDIKDSMNPLFEEVAYPENSYIRSMDIGEVNMKLEVIVPSRAIQADVIDTMKTYMAIVFILLLFFLTLTLLSISRYTKIFTVIVSRMIDVKNNDYSVRMPEYKDKQLNTISSAFNQMTEEIEYLINQVLKSDLLLKENEIKLLQSQMNPHFLVNTMTTISLGAYSRGEKKTYKAITSLNKLIAERLRSTVHESYNSVEAEIHFIELYLFLQHLRHEDKLKYTLEVHDKSILSSRIPRLCIEPLVENAVVHGIEENVEDGFVSLHVYKSAGHIVFEVKDNGNGFNVEQVMSENRDTDSREHLGLYNTDQRLKLIYGSDYGLDIHSEISVGTEITVRIPIEDFDDKSLSKDEIFVEKEAFEKNIEVE